MFNQEKNKDTVTKISNIHIKLYPAIKDSFEVWQYKSLYIIIQAIFTHCVITSQNNKVVM